MKKWVSLWEGDQVERISTKPQQMGCDLLYSNDNNKQRMLQWYALKDVNGGIFDYQSREVELSMTTKTGQTVSVEPVNSVSSG